MRRAWRAVAIYFGFTEPDEHDDAELVYVRPDMASGARWALVLAVVSTAIVLTVLEWSTSDLALGVAIGTLAFGLLQYGSSTQHEVPDAPLGRLPDHLVPQRRRTDIWRSVAWLGVLVPLLWILDRVGPGEFWFVVPGQFLGIAAAQLFGLTRVARWERTHRSQVVVSRSARGVKALYAVPRL